MVDRAIATRLVLRSLGQSESISSLDDRKRLQKLIYLTQAAGVRLGYGFSWYLRGPYSSTLAKDYYNPPPDQTGAAPSLTEEALTRLQAVRGVLDFNERPQDLSDADWLEIVASVHYLERSSKISVADARAKLQREKPKLVEYFDVARAAVDQYFPAPKENQ